MGDCICHCGNIQLEVTAELGEVVDCNFSICSRTGFLHWYVAPEQVVLKTPGLRLSTSAWRAITGGQHFCPTCGIAVIRTSTEHPPPSKPDQQVVLALWHSCVMALRPFACRIAAEGLSG